MAPLNFSDFVVKSPFTAYEQAVVGTTVHLASANDIAIYPFILPYPMEVTNICLFIGVADNTNNSDVGIYDVDGNRLGHVGAQHIPSATSVSLALADGPIVIGPGLYFLAITSAGTTLQYAVGTNGSNFALGLFNAGSTSSGGALPSTIIVNQSLNEGSASPYQGYPPVMILT